MNSCILNDTTINVHTYKLQYPFKRSFNPTPKVYYNCFRNQPFFPIHQRIWKNFFLLLLTVHCWDTLLNPFCKREMKLFNNKTSGSQKKDPSCPASDLRNILLVEISFCQVGGKTNTWGWGTFTAFQPSQLFN